MQYDLTKSQVDLILRDLEEGRLRDKAAERTHNATTSNYGVQATRDLRNKVRKEVVASLRGYRAISRTE